MSARAVISTASSATAGISGDSSDGDSSIGGRSVEQSDNVSIDEGSDDVSSGGDGRIGDGSEEDTGGNCGGCDVGKASWSPRRKSNASVAFADRADKPLPKRAVSADASAINIAQ